MKKTIFKQLEMNFIREFSRNPNDDEIKRLDSLSFFYMRDLKYILKMEIREFPIR